MYKSAMNSEHSRKFYVWTFFCCTITSCTITSLFVCLYERGWAKEKELLFLFCVLFFVGSFCLNWSFLMYVWSLLFNNKPFILWVVQDVYLFSSLQGERVLLQVFVFVSALNLKLMVLSGRHGAERAANDKLEKELDLE